MPSSSSTTSTAWVRGPGGRTGVLGGAFGRGLNKNLIDGYRFLALNYEPGDDIFVFGFSRGAYTARSLVGMIWRIGLVTPRELAGHPAENLFEKVLRLYRSGPEKLPPDTPGDKVPVRFIGVFDTVGALGIPGITRLRYRFHDVKLGLQVAVARQALAIDERRLTFDPCVWSTAGNDVTDVAQVWFEGVHSDIGGGLRTTEPSELSLAWMVREAALAGLQFDFDRFTPVRHPVDPSSPKYASNRSMNAVYAVVNAVKLALGPFRMRGDVVRHRGQARLLEVVRDPASPMFIAAPALIRWQGDIAGRKEKAPNIGWWVTLVQESGELPDRVVEIPPLAAPS